ncbi:MAG TPA: asparagine synthase (glutamine-hydrolyzing) [Turneriella sp.]|nr:asparagine synthase (glutamine-hydrolyzing) [Turneriella sp.]
MCGIAGLFGQVDGARHRVVNMTDQLYHRGPDDYGIYSEDALGVHLGHRRLSILDLSTAGHQPMVHPESGNVICYNGEIYNYRDIRADLLKLGYTFHSNSDTEVALKAYHAWGNKCVERFNGMWALVIFDKERQVIFGSRDRIGVKPLYYALSKEFLIIASEVKAILSTGLIHAKPDMEGMNEYFTFQNIISDRTLFAGVRMLEAGHNFEYQLREKDLQIKRYWDLVYAPQQLDEQEYVELIHEAFHKSLDRHLLSDVDIGATISGGMDSSAIIALASQKIKGMHTFTGYFDTSAIETNDRAVSEKDDARLISNMFGTTHHERLISPQDMIDNLPQIVWYLEDPKVAMCYTFYTIAQKVSQRVKVNLSGTGGDEIFAGYPWRYHLFQNVESESEFRNIYYNYWCRLLNDKERITLFKPQFANQIDFTRSRQVFNHIIDNAGNVSFLNKALYFENKTFLHGMLMVEDKMGMAFSVETRVPFLDNELININVLIPDAYKYRNGVSKYILKRAFDKLLPKEIIHKRKQGFTPPDQTWYRRELSDYLRNLLLGHKTVCHEYIEPKVIEKILNRHALGSDERMLIWSLAFFEGWCRVFLAKTEIPRSLQF